MNAAAWADRIEHEVFAIVEAKGRPLAGLLAALPPLEAPATSRKGRGRPRLQYHKDPDRLDLALMLWLISAHGFSLRKASEFAARMGAQGEVGYYGPDRRVYVRFLRQRSCGADDYSNRAEYLRQKYARFWSDKPEDQSLVCDGAWQASAVWQATAMVAFGCRNAALQAEIFRRLGFVEK